MVAGPDPRVPARAIHQSAPVIRETPVAPAPAKPTNDEMPSIAIPALARLSTEAPFSDGSAALNPRLPAFTADPNPPAPIAVPAIPIAQLASSADVQSMAVASTPAASPAAASPIGAPHRSPSRRCPVRQWQRQRDPNTSWHSDSPTSLGRC